MWTVSRVISQDDCGPRPTVAPPTPPQAAGCCSFCIPSSQPPRQAGGSHSSCTPSLPQLGLVPSCSQHSSLLCSHCRRTPRTAAARQTPRPHSPFCCWPCVPASVGSPPLSNPPLLPAMPGSAWRSSPRCSVRSAPRVASSPQFGTGNEHPTKW